jgi:hypothetical protein
MTRETRLLRALLVMLLVGLVLAGGLVYIVSLDLATAYPTMAGLRLPIFFAVLVGFIPTIVAVTVAFDLLAVVDQGEAFSLRTVRLLRRLKMLVGITAAYLLVGVVGIWVAAAAATGQSKGYVLLPWFAGEVVTLFLFTFISLLERLFAAALELRRDSELTV